MNSLVPSHVQFSAKKPQQWFWPFQQNPLADICHKTKQLHEM